MVIGGFNLVYTTLHLEQLSGTLRIPLGYVYAIMPISGLLIMCFSVYHISNIYSNKINNFCLGKRWCRGFYLRHHFFKVLPLNGVIGESVQLTVSESL